MCLAFDADSLDEVGRRLGDVLEMQPPQGLVDKVKGLKKLKSIADSQPKTVRSGPVAGGRAHRATTSTSPRCRSRPAGPATPAPFITLPAVITKDPRTGGRNVGMYRMQVLDKRSTAMHWQIHKDGRADYLLADGKLEVAVALGLDPVTAYAASAPLPKHVDEFMLAGFLRASRSSSCPAKPSTSRSPPTRRSCSRATSPRTTSPIEGPFGDHTGYYSPAEPFPIFHVTAITKRRDAIYPSIVVGKPPAEDAWLGKATERIFLPAIRMSVPEIVDYDLPGRRRIPQLLHRRDSQELSRPRAEGDARDLGARAPSLTKAVVVVDEWVDVHDYEEVFFRVGANVDPKRDVLHIGGAARPPRPCALTSVLRRQDRHRRQHKGPEEGARAVAGGDRDERGGQPLVDGALGRVRHRRGPGRATAHGGPLRQLLRR